MNIVAGATSKAFTTLECKRNFVGAAGGKVLDRLRHLRQYLASLLKQSD